MKNKLNTLFALFIGLLTGVNLLGGKIVSLFGISVSVGIFMVPATFLITDIVAEVYGKKIAKHFITDGVIVLMVIFLFAGIFTVLPPHERYSFNQEYTTIFGSSLRMIIASIIAFYFSQYHDVIAFEWWKQKTHGKALWLRNNLSTVVSQMIDTVLFMMIAFYKISPQFTVLFILQLALKLFLLLLQIHQQDVMQVALKQ